MNESERNTNDIGTKPLEELKVLEQSTEIEQAPIIPVESSDKKQWEKNFSKRWKKSTYTKNEIIGDIGSIRQAQTVISNNMQFLSQRLMAMENNQKV
jgi:cell fate regulator YaaT (PSP1 superfamily)